MIAKNLLEKGFILEAIDGRLKVSGKPLSDSEREFIRQNKDTILRELSGWRYPDPPVQGSPLIPRREAVQLINAAIVRISKVWSKDGSIEPDDSWHERVNEAAMWGTRGEFLAVIQEWEKSETARAKAAGEAV